MESLQWDKIKSAKTSNILANIDNYNDEMTISQVVRFFERHGLVFTKTMIQNYVRVGIIPPPVEKRYYIKKHLILLTMIDGLKEDYSLDEIGILFKPIMKDLATFDDDIIDMTAVYTEFSSIYDEFIDKKVNLISQIMEESRQKARNYGVESSDETEAAEFLSLLSLMVQTIALKRIVKIIMDK